MGVQQHPLQRLTSPSRSASLALHSAGLCCFALVYYSLETEGNEHAEGFGGLSQFLTIIGLSLATITFILGLLADVFLSPNLFLAKNWVAICAGSLELQISLLYWSLNLINRRLVIAEEYEIDWLLDVGLHLAPVVFLTLDLILLSPPWTVTAYGAMTISSALAMLYWAWIEYCFTKNGWYPYPLFGVLNHAQRAMLFAFSAALMTLSTGLLKWTYGRVNGHVQGRREAARPLKKLD